MPEKYGIQNIKLLIGLPIELGNIADAIGKENSTNWKKWLKFIDAFDEVIDVIKVDWKALKFEFDDLSEVEKLEIKQYLCDKFKIANENLETKIEKSFAILFKIGDVVKDSIDLAQEFKA